MQNRLGTLRSLGTDRPSRASRPASEWRLALLFAGICLPVALIIARVAWLQTAGRERFLSLWDRTTEKLETIPARDGRILTSDGQVLAYDETRYQVAVHYRWLEDPPDPTWLRGQALQRTVPAARKQRAEVGAAQQQVLAEREQMHRDLAAALGLSASELHARFRKIQGRVERIVASVEARRATREMEADAVLDDASPEPPALTEGWRGWWALVVRELTTPPERPEVEPIVVAEELDYHVIAGDVPVSTVARLQSFPSRFRGVDVQLSNHRVYPQGSLAAHLVGSRTALRPEEARQRGQQFPGGDPLAYTAGDPIGRTGIELACDQQLHGIGGVRRKVLNRQREVLRQEVVREPLDGRDVVLSIDGGLQRAAEGLLDAVVARGELPESREPNASADGDSFDGGLPTGGCLVAMDVRTGRVLAAAAAPRHEAQLLVEATQSAWDAVASDPRRPFFPRITQETVPPGSVFKVLTSIALLESRAIDPDAPFECQGYFERPDRERCYLFRHAGIGHGPTTLDQALCQSCNVYFFHAAQQLGANPLVTWAERFGFGRATGSHLPGERAGQVPRPGAPGTADGRWYPGTTRQLAIGQASLAVTPLQVARLMAAVANDGWLLNPRFVEAAAGSQVPDSPTASSSPIQLAGFEIPAGVSRDDTAVRVEGLSPGTLTRVRQGLLLTVEDPRGTGHEARLDGLRIAGKTGTAEVGGGRPDHAWFAGYAPANAPRVAIVVLVENGGSGGRVAAPIAREFLRRLADDGILPRVAPKRPTPAVEPLAADLIPPPAE